MNSKEYYEFEGVGGVNCDLCKTEFEGGEIRYAYKKMVVCRLCLIVKCLIMPDDNVGA